MLTLDSGACNTIPFSALGDPKAVREGSKRYVRLPSGKVARVISLNGVWVAEMGMLEYTTQSLPPVTGFPEGTEVFVGDYNGNIARLINGVWRYISPFIVAWASRPAANAVPVGTEIQVTDYGNQKWVSDGTYWRPAQGRILLAQKSADGSAFLASLTNTTSGEFAITKPVIKAGMVIPNSRIKIEGLTVKSGSLQAFTPAVYLGKTASMATDPAVGSIGGTLTADTAACRWDLLAYFGTATNMFLRSGAVAPQSQGSSTVFSQATNVDTTVDMYVTLGVLASTAVVDIYMLKSYSIFLEA